MAEQDARGDRSAREICQRFAGEHKLVFTEAGTVGFGRLCVGFGNDDNYLEYNPRSSGGSFDEIWPHDRRLSPPRDLTPNAYHKHNCFAVLVEDDDYDKAIEELAAWVQHLERQGKVEVCHYETGASGIQALFSGTMGRALRFVDTME